MGSLSTLQKRDDSEFIDLLMVELHNSDLLNDFIDQLVAAPHLTSALEESALALISSGKLNETLLMSSLRNSGRLPEFFESVLNDEDLNSQLYVVARDILKGVEDGGELAARDALEKSAPFLSGLYGETMSPRVKRDYYNDDLLENAYGMSKRDLIDSIVNIIAEISSSGLVLRIVSSILGNQTLVQYGLNLFSQIITSVDWQSVFNAIKDSGIIQSIFTLIMNLLAGLFSGDTLSSFLSDLFSGNSTTGLFLGNLFGLVVEIGGELFSSLTKSGGLLSELLGTFFNGTDSSSTSSSSGGGFLLGLFDSLFGSSSDSGSKSESGSSGSDSSGSSSGGFFSSLFDSLFGDSSNGDSSSSSNSNSLGSMADDMVDSMFGGSSSGSSGGSGSSAQTCCCSPDKIKKRALKRALKRKVKRSIKRTITGGKVQMPDGMLGYLVAAK